MSLSSNCELEAPGSLKLTSYLNGCWGADGWDAIVLHQTTLYFETFAVGALTVLAHSGNLIKPNTGNP